MTDITRSTLWKILNEAFNAILQMLRQEIPEIRMDSGSRSTQAFLFRSYAEYVVGDRVIVISFDIQKEVNRIHVWGDISEEDGYILKDVMEEYVSNDQEEDRFVELVGEFASRCLSETALIASGLN